MAFKPAQKPRYIAACSLFRCSELNFRRGLFIMGRMPRIRISMRCLRRVRFRRTNLQQRTQRLPCQRDLAVIQHLDNHYDYDGRIPTSAEFGKHAIFLYRTVQSSRPNRPTSHIQARITPTRIRAITMFKIGTVEPPLSGRYLVAYDLRYPP